MSDEREVLSALIDREPVDADVLARVLEEPANRALLVEFVRLRGRIQLDDHGEGRNLQLSRPTKRARRRSWPAAVAALVLLGLGLAGGAGLERYASRERPPEPTRVVQLEPGPAQR
jgi:hypothetical protein